jgi:hypothetical protein
MLTNEPSNTIHFLNHPQKNLNRKVKVYNMYEDLASLPSWKELLEIKDKEERGRILKIARDIHGDAALAAFWGISKPNIQSMSYTLKITSSQKKKAVPTDKDGNQLIEGDKLKSIIKEIESTKNNSLVFMTHIVQIEEMLKSMQVSFHEVSEAFHTVLTKSNMDHDSVSKFTTEGVFTGEELSKRITNLDAQVLKDKNYFFSVALIELKENKGE